MKLDEEEAEGRRQEMGHGRQEPRDMETGDGRWKAGVRRWEAGDVVKGNKRDNPKRFKRVCCEIFEFGFNFAEIFDPKV